VGVTVMRGSIRPLFHQFARDLGWGRVALGGAVVREVPGHHGTVLREPHVRQLAERLLEALA
jgi:aspartate racemase